MRRNPTWVKWHRRLVGKQIEWSPKRRWLKFGHILKRRKGRAFKARASGL